MKIIFFTILLSASLFSTSIFTVENVNNLKIYYANKSDFLNREQNKYIKTKTEEKFKSVGIELNKVDASAFMIKIESLEVEESHAVLVSIALGEEVLTNRKDKIGTFAWTYYKTDLMEIDEPYKDILESVDYLVDEFIEAYLDDMQ
ncbi:hypothetical protein [Sulfurimonas sp.]